MVCLFFISCRSEDEVVLDSNSNQPIEVSVIFSEDSMAFIEEGYLDTVLLSDHFYIEEEQLYFVSGSAGTGSSSIPISYLEVSNLSKTLVYPYLWDWFKKGEPIKINEGILFESSPFDSIVTMTPYKLWWKAKCGKRMRGFTSACMGTFGRHKIMGASMQWTVNPYTTCGAGRFFCLERAQVVGAISYYNGPNCGGALPFKVDIERFVCP